MAFTPIEDFQQVLESGMHQYTQCALKSPGKFFENKGQTQEREFAMSMEEFEERINAIAAPILTHGNKPIASVAVAGPSYRLNKERMTEIGSGLLATVREIAKEFEIATNS